MVWQRSQLRGGKKLKSSNFQLLDKPRVTKSIFTINKDFNFDKEISLDMENNIKIAETSDEDLTSLVVLNLRFFKDNELTNVPFNLEIEIEGFFGWDEELEENEDKLEVLLKENAPAILYSYLRPIITAMTVEANLPTLVIPLMNFRKE